MKTQKELHDLQDQWEARLEAEGLGLIEPEAQFKDVGGAKKIKRNWARLDAELNGIEPGSAAVMSNSPPTADANGTTFYNGRSKEPTCAFDDLDSQWEALMLKLVATAKEAEIADRARGSVCGLDDRHRPRGLRIKRKHRELPRDHRERMYRHILGDSAKDGDGPRFSEWVSQQIPPYAHSDAGNGPLSIVDVEEPAYQWVASCEANWALEPEETQTEKKAEEIRMSPIVDTMTYPPGRGPYQRSLIAQSNSDITG